LVLVNVTTGRCSQTSPPKPRIEIADQRRPDGSISASPFSPRVNATCSTFQSQPLGLRSSAFSPGEVFRPNGADRRHPTDGIRPPRSRQSSSESLRRANTGVPTTTECTATSIGLRRSDCVDCRTTTIGYSARSRGPSGGARSLPGRAVGPRGLRGYRTPGSLRSGCRPLAEAR